jgi:hypothetical protein
MRHSFTYFMVQCDGRDMIRAKLFNIGQNALGSYFDR